MIFSASGSAWARERERARATKRKKSWNLSDGAKSRRNQEDQIKSPPMLRRVT